MDRARQRLYVAELGNNSVGVIDLTTNHLIRTIEGFSEPQGIAYEASTDTVYVANGGDGSVRLLRGSDLQPVGRIEIGTDADNMLIDIAHRRVIVGFGDGALALIDPQARKVVADIPLKAHPESFRLDSDAKRAYVNVPDAHEIAVVDLSALRQVDSWQTREYSSNFPMSLDDARQRLWVAFRDPPKLVAFDTQTGAQITALNTCNDADDLFVDSTRDRIYVSCGAGVVEVWDEHGSSSIRLLSFPTVAGARTSLFVPELGRLYLAVRATASVPATLWILRVPPLN
jgi:YVTN family beta-propeller protein